MRMASLRGDLHICGMRLHDSVMDLTNVHQTHDWVHRMMEGSLDTRATLVNAASSKVSYILLYVTAAASMVELEACR